MDKQEPNTKELETEIKLHINKALYKNGVISEEMYSRAQNLILEMTY